MGSIKHAKTSLIPAPLDNSRIAGPDWNQEHEFDLTPADIQGLEEQLIPVEQVVAYRDQALAAAVSAGESKIAAAQSATDAQAAVDTALTALSGPGGADLVGTPDGTVQDGLDARPTTTALAATTGAATIGIPGGNVQTGLDARPTSVQIAAPDFADLIGFSPSGIGAVDTNVGAALDTTRQYPSGFFYSEHGAKVNRMQDRLFVGDAALNPGTNVTVQPDWLTTYQLAKGRTNGFMQISQAAILNNNTGSASIALITGAQTATLLDGYNAIAVTGIAVANKDTGTGNSYAGYFEGYREVNADGGAYGIEIDTINYAELVQINPYLQISDQVVGLQIASGGEYSSVGQFDASSAINIRNNGARFANGLMIGADALTMNSGIGEAVALATGHKIQWYGGSGIGTSAIYCTGTTTAGGTALSFGEGFVGFLNEIGRNQFRIATNPNSSNFIGVNSVVAGTSPQVLALGLDTNIDLQLVPKGTGNIWLGAYTAGAPAATGYITVKDAAGVVRKLLAAP